MRGLESLLAQRGSFLLLERRGMCPWCLFPVDRDRGHLLRCLYEFSAEITFAPAR